MKLFTNIQKYIDDGYINCQKHPEFDLLIFDYSQKCQFERMWDEVTLVCRGLITDLDYNLVARPFGKFFNIEEREEPLPNEPFEVTEKMDGSLGILYQYKGTPYLSTRGSFTSDQAVKGTQILREKYNLEYNPKLTYLFEIIYPENRIVVDYKGVEDLILLTVIETETGKELPLDGLSQFNRVKKYDGIKDIGLLRQDESKDREGYVVHFLGESNLRIKLKYQEYVRLHRILTGVNSKTIWELLKNNQPFDDLICHVPDEFHQWVKKTKDDLLSKYQEIEKKCKKDFRVLDSRKDTAMYFKSCSNPSVLFSILDNKDYSRTIWDMIKPKAIKPFVQDEN